MDWFYSLVGGSDSSSSKATEPSRQKWLDMQQASSSGGSNTPQVRSSERSQLVANPGLSNSSLAPRGSRSLADPRHLPEPAHPDDSPRQARGARRRALQAWEVESDLSEGVASEGERAMNRWTPFMNKEETEAADHLESRMREQFEPDGGVEDHGKLESYEEHALGMRQANRKMFSNVRGEEQALALQDEEAEEEEEDGDDDDDEMVRNNRERAKKEGLAFHELPGDGNWNTHGGKWISSTGGGGLSIDHTHKISYAYYEEMKFKDFDIEAEVMVSDGDHAGLMFHMLESSGHNPVHYYALCVNLAKHQAELRSPNEAIALAHVNVQRHSWFQMRVRAAGSTLMMFVDSKQVGQRVCYHEKDRVWSREHNEECVVKKNWCDGTYDLDCNYGVREGVAGRLIENMDGSVGLWTAKSVASIRNIVVINLEEIVKDMRLHDQRMVDEALVMKEKAKSTRAKMLRRTKAARLIQEISKLNLHIMHQRMQMYDQAERQGRDDALRDKKLLTWFALFSVFQRFNDVMAQPEKQERRTQLYLEWLDAKDPPPPAPPLKDPPRQTDEELHYRYEERRNKYADRWEKAGKMVVGQERFEKILNMESGPAEREKRLIAQKCFAKATEVMSEQEHQEFLRKAWRLENDWTSMDDVAEVTEEIERWRDEKVKAAVATAQSREKSRGRTKALP